jgi:hypothetical protein
VGGEPLACDPYYWLPRRQRMHRRRSNPTGLQDPSNSPEHNRHGSARRIGDRRSTSELHRTSRRRGTASGSRAPSRAGRCTGTRRTRRRQKAIAKPVITGIERALVIARARSIEVSTRRDQACVAGPALHTGLALARVRKRIALRAQRQGASRRSDGRWGSGSIAACCRGAGRGRWCCRRRRGQQGSVAGAFLQVALVEGALLVACASGLEVAAYKLLHGVYSVAAGAEGAWDASCGAGFAEWNYYTSRGCAGRRRAGGSLCCGVRGSCGQGEDDVSHFD